MSNKVITIVSIAIVSLGILAVVAAFILEYLNISSTEKCSLKIMSVSNSVSGNYHKEYTIFTVAHKDGVEYTLPEVNTDLVRWYHEGDLLPVIINSYKDNSIKIFIDKENIKNFK